MKDDVAAVKTRIKFRSYVLSFPGYSRHDGSKLLQRMQIPLRQVLVRLSLIQTWIFLYTPKYIMAEI